MAEAKNVVKILLIVFAIVLILYIVMRLMSSSDAYCNCTGMATKFDRAPYTFWKGAEWPLSAETPFVRDELLRCDSTYCGEPCAKPCANITIQEPCAAPTCARRTPCSVPKLDMDCCDSPPPCPRIRYDESAMPNCGVDCYSDGGFQRLDRTYVRTMDTDKDDIRDKMDGLTCSERIAMPKCCVGRRRTDLVSLASVNGGMLPPGAVVNNEIRYEEMAPVSDYRYGGYGPCQNARSFSGSDAYVGVL